jgi:heptosyltransferase-2
MQTLVRMPNWLGDAVMATPALESLLCDRRVSGIVLVGSPLVAELFEGDPRWRHVEVDRSRDAWLRPAAINRLGHSLRRRFGPFDLAVAFPNSVSSALLIAATGSRRRYGASRGWANCLLTEPVRVRASDHQAEIYQSVVNACLESRQEAGPTHLFVASPQRYLQPTLGVHPGATYGSAKRWEPQRFADVAAALADDYEIAIFGSDAEREIADQIENHLKRHGIRKCENLAGQTTVRQLVERIAGLDLMITNDSGPMHVAGAFQVPTVAVFGPTNATQTSPWRHSRLAIVRHDLPCAPCMKRTCPLGHHACMKEITVEEVVAAARSVERRKAGAQTRSARI